MARGAGLTAEAAPAAKLRPAADRWYWLLWVAVALVAGLFVMRFGMRALGVLPDLPLPGLVYTVSAPWVERLYGVLPPTSMRFDQASIEVASLAVAGGVVALGLAAYVLTLLAGWALRRPNAA